MLNGGEPSGPARSADSASLYCSDKDSQKHNPKNLPRTNMIVNKFPTPQRSAELAAAALVSSTAVGFGEWVYGKINRGLYQVRVLSEAELYCTRQ
jgi:hypothetical protein